MSIEDCIFCGTKKVTHDEWRITNEYKPVFQNKYLYKLQCRECEAESLYLEEKRIYPYVSYGLPLSKDVPAEISKVFDEAREIAEKSPKCGNILIRICTELILIWIVETRLPEKLEEFKGVKMIGKKIARLKEYNIDGINSKLFNMITILNKYGNDNAHSSREIDDSDTFESFEMLYNFIHRITENVLRLIEEDIQINQAQQKIKL